MSNPVCLHCRRSTRALDLIPDREICTFCAVKLPADQYPPRCEKVSQDTFIDRLILTTTPTVPGREITESVGIVSAQVAIGLNLFKDLGQAFRDVAGGRSANLQNMLAASRKAAFDEIEQEARRTRCGCRRRRRFRHLRILRRQRHGARLGHRHRCPLRADPAGRGSRLTTNTNQPTLTRRTS